MNDEFHGQGGSYILDPKTGKRARVEAPTREAPAEAPAPPIERLPSPLNLTSSTPQPLAPQGEGGDGGGQEAPNVAPLRGRRKPTDEPGS